VETSNDLSELGLNTRKKPEMKREVGVRSSSLDNRHIMFYATEDAVEDFREYGYVLDYVVDSSLHSLTVDARFDFQEVLDYISNYG
jgi:hypothetical protein